MGCTTTKYKEIKTAETKAWLIVQYITQSFKKEIDLNKNDKMPTFLIPLYILIHISYYIHTNAMCMRHTMNTKCTNTHIYICIYICIWIWIYGFIYIYIYIYIYIFTYTH